MNRQQHLADFIAEHFEALSAKIASNTPLPTQQSSEAVVTDWLNNHIAHLRGKTGRMGEWAAQLVEAACEVNLPVGEVFAYIKTLNKHLVDNCIGNIPDVYDLDIAILLSESAARFEQSVVEYFAQRVYEDSLTHQRRQKAILESVEQPMALINAEGQIDVVNRTFSQMFTSNPDAFADQNLPALCNEETASRLRSLLKQKKMEQSKSTFSGQIKFGSKTITGNFTLQPYFNADGLRAGASIFIEQDGEAGTEVNAGIQYLEERLLPLAPFAIQVTDREGHITYNSEHIVALGISEYQGQEPICCYLHHQRYGKDRPCYCGHIFDTGHFHMEEIGLDTGVAMKWFLTLSLPLPDTAGQVARVLTCVYDMTHRKQVQKQLESHIVKQQRSSLVAQLSITVAHQLRNPLSVVLGFAEMLSKGLAPDQYAEAVSRILRNSVRCKEIVENLLDFGKGMPLERRPIDLENLVRESVRTLLTPAQNRLIDWRFSGKPAIIECVPEQIMQVLLSLIDNALHVAHSQVVCAVENKGDQVRFRVVDDGPGIPLEFRDRVFEPFFTTRRDEGATGLGLSLARAVAADYGGSLTVSSPVAGEPRGACMILQLPLMKKGAGASATAPGKEFAPAKSRSRHILVVDDEVDLQEMLKANLTLRGYTADTVGTGMEALEKLSNTKYDAVVLDYLLKGALSGRQLYHEISEQYPAVVPRVLFITANMLEYQTRLFLEGTGRPVLEKPFLIADFMSELVALMG